MKRLLNTLYVTSENSYISKEGETVLISKSDGSKVRFPIINLESIICFGTMTCSTPLLELCVDKGITISFVNNYGKFYARAEGAVSGNVLLRKEQFRKAENPEEAIKIARSIVIGKISNCRAVLMRSLRDNVYDEEVSEKLHNACGVLMNRIKGVQSSNSIDRIRGLEGDSAREYFSVFNYLILSNKDVFSFNERNRRPPLDNVNALLSFAYVLLMHDVSSAIKSVGLDQCVGYLHVDRPGRQSLALDIMEELRPYLADRLVLSLINRKQVIASNFIKKESGAIYLDENSRKALITSYQKRKEEEITHPFLGEKIKIGLLPYVQVLLLARYIRGDLDAYPPFVWK